MAVTKIADVIVPEIFSPYVQQQTEEKSRLVQSGVMPRVAKIDEKLAGGGLTFQVPSWKPLGNVAENIVSDDETTDAVPQKTGTAQETLVRLSRHQAWSAMDLTASLAGSDPMESIASEVSTYWALRLQAAMIATMQGVFADNAAVPSGGDTHVQDDLTVDISGVYSAGTTDFSAEAFIDALGTLGDSEDKIVAVMMHSIVYQRAKKNNLIDFIADAANPHAEGFPMFLGKHVIVDDGMPNPSAPAPATTGAGIYHTWLLGAGAFGYGATAAEVPTEIERNASAGSGGGQDILHNRVVWAVHPSGHRYIGSAPNGGPSNAATAENLGHADSWSRRFPERKQIAIARLITTEHA